MLNNQKIFLAIAIFLTVFLLWDKWERQQITTENGEVITKTKLKINSNNTAIKTDDIPDVSTPAPQIDLPDIATTSSADSIIINTDLLTLEIGLKGGVVQKAFLNRYPKTLKSSEKFQLLSNETNNTFQAQSGLASTNNTLPTHLSQFNSQQKTYQLTNDTLTVPLTWTNDKGVSVNKNFHFKKGSYVVAINYTIANQTNTPIAVKSYARLERSAIDKSNLITQTVVGGIIYNEADQTVQKEEFDDWSDLDNITQKGGWVAMIEQYFVAVFIPDLAKTHTYTSSVQNNLYKLTIANSQTNIPAKSTVTLPANQLYLGPKEYAKIDAIAEGLHYTLDYGWLDILASPLAWVLHKINNYVSSWGWSIILLTVLIKLIFYPLSEKSYRSMASMRKLAPRLAKLKENYGDDKQKYGQKTMELYRQEKVNPASGCLPILVQMPVFIAFYWMLLDTVELRQTAFMYLPDLSSLDPYYILPILMGGSMFIQQKLNPPPPDPTQAKVMMALPFVFTILFFWFPSGLVLYWVVNNVLSIAQQWLINKRINV